MARTRQKRLKSPSTPKPATRRRRVQELDEAQDIQRQKIKDLISSRKGENYATISALLGRSHSYIQQYITRGSPRFLLESDRRKIARHFGIPAHEFLIDEEHAEDEPPENDAIIMIALWTTPGVDNGADNRIGIKTGRIEAEQGLPFRRDWIEAHFPAAADLAAIRITGDAMAPTLLNGSFALVDRSQVSAQRDGIYALSAGGEILPRRLSMSPLTGLVTIAADNHLYPNQPDCTPDSLSIFGRIVWTGRFI